MTTGWVIRNIVIGEIRNEQIWMVKSIFVKLFVGAGSENKEC